MTLGQCAEPTFDEKIRCDSGTSTDGFVWKIEVKQLPVFDTCDVRRRKHRFTVHQIGVDRWCCDPKETVARIQSFYDDIKNTDPATGDYRRMVPIPELCQAYRKVCCRKVDGEYQRFVDTAVDIEMAAVSIDVSEPTKCFDRFTVDVTYSNQMLNGTDIVWGAFPGTGPLVNEIRPINTTAEITNAICKVSSTDRVEKINANKSAFLGLRDADCATHPFASGTECCQPLSGEICNRILPQNTAGVKFLNIFKEEITENFEIEILVNDPAELCRLRQLKNSVNCEDAYLFEYIQRRGDIAFCSCQLLPRHTGKIGRVTVSDAKFCCTPIKIVKLEINVKNNYCINSSGSRVGNDGWEDWIANTGKQELNCCAGDGSLRPLTGEQELDDTGQAVDLGTGGVCPAKDRLYAGFLHYDEIDFNVQLPGCFSDVPPAESGTICDCDSIATCPCVPYATINPPPPPLIEENTDA